MSVAATLGGEVRIGVGNREHCYVAILNRAEALSFAGMIKALVESLPAD